VVHQPSCVDNRGEPVNAGSLFQPPSRFNADERSNAYLRPRFRTSGNGRSATRFTAGSSPIDPPDGPTEPSIDRPANARSRIEAVRKGIVETWRSLVRVFQLVWATSRVFTVVLAAVTLIQSVIPASQVWLAGQLIDEVARGVTAGGGDEFVRSIIILAVLQLVLFLAASLFQTLGNITQQLLQEKLAIEVQLTIMRHANLLDLAAFENAAYYDQLQQAQRESANRPVQMVSSVFGLIRSAITFASMIALLVSLSPWIAVGVLIAPIPAFISGSRYGWWGFQQMRRQSPARRRMSYLTNVLTTDTYNKEIKLFTIGDHFITRYRDIATGYYQETRQLLVRRYLAGFGWGAITIGASSATYLYVAILALRGSITLGSLAVFVQAAQQVQSSFQGLLGGVQGIYEHGLYLSTLYELLDREPQIQAPENPVPLEIPFQQGIEFRNVSFRYPDTDRIALDNVSFTIGLDETVALVGKNGAGKSTIVKLLGRLYDPDKGQIFINGHDVRDYDPQELRRAIGVVFQDYVAY
jgi:ATP-binding cassette, subfamily B, bacterial